MYRRTHNVFLVVGFFTLVAGCQSSTPRTAMDILTKSKAALAEVEHISYRANYGATGWLVSRVPVVEGDVVMGPKSKWDLARYRCDVSIKGSDDEEAVSFISGSDGDVYFLLDKETKMAYEDMDVAVLGSNGRNLQRVLMESFVDENPFGDDLKADSVELTGSQSVNGEDCFEIHIKSEAPPQVSWLVSKKDFLPRRITRTYPNRRDPEGEPGTTHLTVTNLKVNPKFAKNPFVLSVPSGYTKTEDFAP